VKARDLAATTGKTVYLDKGLFYPASFSNNVTVQGGWTYSGGANWTNCDGTASTSSIGGGGENTAVTLFAGTVTLDTLTITNPASAGTGGMIGASVQAGQLTLKNVNISVAGAGPVPAAALQTQQAGSPTTSCSAGTGTNASPAEATGGAPGQVVYSTNGGIVQNAGQNGSNGIAGSNGTNGGPPKTGTDCSYDGDGCQFDSVTGNPGNAGCAGPGGYGGYGGYTGGSTVGIFAFGGTVSFVGTVNITVGNGADGTAGSAGTSGAPGSAGSAGASVPITTGCVVTPPGCKVGGGSCGCKGTAGALPGGFAGGTGGTGQAGGPGGGGAGGDSYCYVTAASGAVTGNLSSCTHGSGGKGGLDGDGHTTYKGPDGKADVHN
jgi:hypothetical protein